MKTEKKPSCTFEELETLGVQNLSVGVQNLGQILPRRFSTGSFGLGYNGKVFLQLPNGKIAKCQATINITVIDSKNSEAEAA